MLQLGIKDKFVPTFDPPAPTPRAVNYAFNDSVDARFAEATFGRLGEAGKTIADIKRVKCLMDEEKMVQVVYVPVEHYFSVTEAETPESVRRKGQLGTCPTWCVRVCLGYF